MRSNEPIKPTAAPYPYLQIGSGLTFVAMKADREPPFWYRDSVTLKKLLQGTWQDVSSDFVKKLLDAVKRNDRAVIDDLLDELKGLGPEMGKALGKAPEAIYSNLLTKANAFWTLHGKEVGMEKPKTLPKAYRNDMAELHARQVKAFAEAYPERIVEPEIMRQVDLLLETETPDALAISGIVDRLSMLEMSEDYWDKLSEVQVSRAWHANGVRYAKQNGIKTGRITGPMDQLTCPVCRHLVGCPIEIDDMIDKIDSDLDILDPDEYVAAWSFPRIHDVDGVDREELGALLVQNGWLPGFHPG